jgi:circadian clock protein KaiC
VTAERGDKTLTRHGLEEYVSDCVVLLDHRVTDQIATRRLRIVKYRGTSHGTNEFPFLIDEDGIEVLPITGARLDHPAPSERISTGVPGLDEVLGGRGVYRGATVLVSGTAGTGKSSLAAQIAEASCRRGERVLYFAFEESPDQITRNMRSIGIDLASPVRKGLLRLEAARPTLQGLEAHLTRIYREVRGFQPRLVIVDPITNLSRSGTEKAAEAMLMRLIDFLKSGQITTVMTTLTSGGGPREATEVGVSSLVDTWILLQIVESDGERNRFLYVLKSRGMAHSNRVRSFQVTDRGIQLGDASGGNGPVRRGPSSAARVAGGSSDAGGRRPRVRRRAGK